MLHGPVCASLSNQCEDKTNTSKRNELWAAGQELPDDFISGHIWWVKNNPNTHMRAHIHTHIDIHDCTHMALTVIITRGNKFTQSFIVALPDWLKNFKFSLTAASDSISSGRDKTVQEARKTLKKICLPLGFTWKYQLHVGTSTRKKGFSAEIQNISMDFVKFPHLCIFLFLSLHCIFFFLSPSLPLSTLFHSQHTIVSVLVDVSKRCYSRAEASKGVCASEGDRFWESERGHLQVQVNPPHFSGLALHLSLHIEGRSDQHIIRPGDKKLNFKEKQRARAFAWSDKGVSTHPSPFRSVTATA